MKQVRGCSERMRADVEKAQKGAQRELCVAFLTVELRVIVRGGRDSTV